MRAVSAISDEVLVDTDYNRSSSVPKYGDIA